MGPMCSACRTTAAQTAPPPASTSARASTQTRLCGAGAAAGALPRAAAEPAAQHGLVHPQQPPLLRCPHASKSVAASVLRSGPPAPVYPPSLLLHSRLWGSHGSVAVCWHVSWGKTLVLAHLAWYHRGGSLRVSGCVRRARCEVVMQQQQQQQHRLSTPAGVAVWRQLVLGWRAPSHAHAPSKLPLHEAWAVNAMVEATKDAPLLLSLRWPASSPLL
mmetsp:Transcript_11834/g.32337  ORF Transcript_11834/g.32337 Transcript_11834/m.32337 type:complete len:217 (+) Transcript_11834:1785-2435(+)